MNSNGIVQIHGKDYMTVARRVELAHEARTLESLETEVLSHNPVVIKARVFIKGKVFEQGEGRSSYDGKLHCLFTRGSFPGGNIQVELDPGRSDKNSRTFLGAVGLFPFVCPKSLVVVVGRLKSPVAPEEFPSNDK